MAEVSPTPSTHSTVSMETQTASLGLEHSPSSASSFVPPRPLASSPSSFIPPRATEESTQLIQGMYWGSDFKLTIIYSYSENDSNTTQYSYYPSRWSGLPFCWNSSGLGDDFDDLWHHWHIRVEKTI